MSAVWRQGKSLNINPSGVRQIGEAMKEAVDEIRAEYPTVKGLFSHINPEGVI
jgi:hypothetical protein